MMHHPETPLEHILTNSYKADLVDYINQHPGDFAKLCQLALSGKQPYSQKAAWLLWSCMKKNDPRVKKYYHKIINVLPQIPGRQQRELLMVLEKMDLNTKFVAPLFDTCTAIWQTLNNKPSIRYVALRIMIKIGHRYPDLANETRLLTGDIYIDQLSGPVRKSVLRLVQSL